MKAADIPAEEQTRLKALYALDVLDTPQDPILDGLTEIVSTLTGAEIALVSLVDHDRQWFKSRYGLDVAQTPRELAFCAHAILHDDVFSVPDALADDRFRDNPLVLKEPGIRSYYGAPLKTRSGARIGTLCSIHKQKRQLSNAQIKQLEMLAQTVVERMEMTKAARQSREYMAQLTTLSRIQTDFISGEKQGNENFETLLASIIGLTQSEYGFIGEVLEDDQGLYLRTRAITDISWNEETKRFYDENAPTGLEFRNLETLFGHVLKTNELLIANEAPSHPQAAGIPHGHPPLNAFLGIPLRKGKKMIGMVGIANRKQGYSEALVKKLGPLLNCVSTIIIGQQSEEGLQTALKELEESERRYALAVEGANDGIFEWDLINKERRYLSPRFCEIIGWDESEIPTAPEDYIKIVHPDDREALMDAMEKVLHSNHQFDVEHRILGRNAEFTWIRSRGRTEFDSETGQPVRFLGTTTDVSLLKQREAELEIARDEAQKASRLKTEFLANMSHEIRTPLNGVLGMAQLLSRSDLNASQRNQVQTIENSGQALLSLLSDVLDIARIESGELKLQEEPLALEAILDRSLATIEGPLLTKGISLETDIQLDDERLFRGDDRRIGQIIVNLLGNAAKFIEEGKIRLTATVRQNNTLEVVVSDTGPGISPDQQEVIFDRFRQADGSVTRKYGGTGLGLSISRELARMMGGDIRVESDLGQGATFIFTCELAEMASQQKAAQLPENEMGELSLSGRRILIAEDSVVNQEVITEMLSIVGDFSVTISNDGAEALEALAASRFDLLLLDIQMPRVNGVEVMTAVRNGKTLQRDIPILVLTANAMAGAREAYIEAGADDYLSKPVQLEALETKIRRLLGPAEIAEAS